MRHHRCYRLLAWTPRALATAQWASRTEDHSGSTLSWCRSRAHVQGGPRAEHIADDFRDAEGELEQGGSPSANLQGSWRRRLQALNFPRGPVTCLPTFIHVCEMRLQQQSMGCLSVLPAGRNALQGAVVCICDREISRRRLVPGMPNCARQACS